MIYYAVHFGKPVLFFALGQRSTTHTARLTLRLVEQFLKDVGIDDAEAVDFLLAEHMSRRGKLC